MFYRDSLIERTWRGVLAAKWEGLFGGLNVLGGALTRPPVAGEGQPCASTRVRQRTDGRPMGGVYGGPARWGTPTSSVAGFCEGLASIPLIMVERFFDVWAAPPPPTYAYPCSGYASDPTPSAASRIVEEADVFLSSVPGGGALLSDLVENVALKTGCDQATVRSVILRNFSSNGELVWKSTGGQGGGSVVDQMKSALQRLGYTDIRDDYALTGIPSRNDRAALLAFDGQDPAVLCYPTNPGEVFDPMIREAALFQAGEVGLNQTAHYVWVSDGIDDFFYDFRGRVVIAQLPTRKTAVVVPQ